MKTIFTRQMSGNFAAIVILFSLVASIAASGAGPIPPEALVNEVMLYPFEGLSPSPDGKWIAYESSDPTKPIRFEYEGQRYASSGFPMLAGASGMCVWVTELSTGKSIQLTSKEVSSWSPSWSPDGQRLAFYSDRDGQTALWVWDRTSGAARKVSSAPIFFSWWRQRPAWSLDGKTILTKLLPEGMSLTDVLSLSPFYKSAMNKDKPRESDPNKPTVKVYSFHPGEQKMSKAVTASGQLEMTAFYDALHLSDLARIDVESGNVTRLIKRVRAIWYGYSPDQKSIAFKSVDGITPNTQQIVSTLKTYSVVTGSLSEIATAFTDPNILSASLSWSPDSTRIAYCDTGKTAERAAWVVDVNSKIKTKVSDGVDKTSLTFNWGSPIWNKAGTRLYLLDPSAGRLWEVSADGKSTRELAQLPGLKVKDIATDSTFANSWTADGADSIYVRTHDDSTKKDAFYSLQVASGKAAKVYEGDESISMREMGAFVGTPGGSHSLFYSSESATHSTDVWEIDGSTGKTRQLSKLNSQFDERSMGRVRIIEFYSLRGERLRASLLLPGDFKEGTRYPTIVWVYGGDMGSDKGNRFAFGWGEAFNPQMWASRGYAVLYPDVPLHEGTPVDDLVSAVLPAVNKAIELGVADPQRLALMGQSFGGYNTIALLTRTSIFKAAVAMSAAATDLYTGYTYFMDGTAPAQGYYEEGQGSMKGNPWEFKTRYWENSPFFFLEKVTTPLMIQRGTTDNISVQSGNVFNALRRLGKDVELVEYEYENHVVQQPVNLIDFWNRRIEWVDRYLGEKPAGAGQ